MNHQDERDFAEEAFNEALLCDESELTPDPLAQYLAEAMYTINRAMSCIRDTMEGASHWSDAERGDYDKLVAARDHIWHMRQTIDPTLKD